MPATIPSSPPRRHWFQFSLSQLLVVIAFFAVAFAAWVRVEYLDSRTGDPAVNSAERWLTWLAGVGTFGAGVGTFFRRGFVGAVLALPMAFIASIAAFNLTDPTFDAVVVENGVQQYELKITPNYVVNSVYAVTVSDNSGTVASRREPVVGLQYLPLPPSTPSGILLTVNCELQFDRGFAACSRSVTKQVETP